MPTTPSPAYRKLDVPPKASPVAVRIRYRELAQLHHPDKRPNGSAEQVTAAERMREINAAYDLIEDAPLQHRERPVEPTHEPPAPRANWLTRLEIDPVKFLYGASAGGALAYWLGLRELGQDTLYSLLVAVAMGIVFTRTSWISNRLLEEIVGFLPRR